MRELLWNWVGAALDELLILVGIAIRFALVVLALVLLGVIP